MILKFLHQNMHNSYNYLFFQKMQKLTRTCYNVYNPEKTILFK